MSAIHHTDYFSSEPNAGCQRLFGLSRIVNSWRVNLRQRIARRSMRQWVASELGQYSDRELAELGLRAADIAYVADEALVAHCRAIAKL